MKILVIPTWYPCGADKLMGQYHKEFTEALNKYDIQANILYIYRMRLKEPLKYIFSKKKKIINESNYKVYIYKALNLSKFGFDYQIKKYIKNLDKAYKDYLKTNDKPDVIHAMVTVPAGYAACILGKKYNIPVVVTEHGGALERFFTKSNLKKYGKYVLENSTYSTVSNYMKKIVNEYKEECFVIPNLVNTDIFKNNTNRKIDRTFNLVTVCALREGKRLDIAFKAIKKLIDKGLNIHYDIIGDGFYEKIYRATCHNEGLDDYVSFLGRKTKKEISQILNKEHVLLISSELESFAIPGVEALAAGLPVISTNCLGPTEYLDKESGILCNVNDPDDMARAILEMYNNYSLYNRKTLVKKAEKYNEENVVKIAKKVYEYALKSRKK